MHIRSQEEWRELFAAQAASGLSARYFCHQHKICPKHFSLRKKQLAWSAPASLSNFVPIAVSNVVGKKSPAPTAQTITATSPPLVLHHNGCACHFETLPSPEWLAHFLRALA
jgi:hypothetical protein